MEFPRLRVESELQLPAYTTATAIPDPSHVFNLCHSLWQLRILNTLNETRDRTHILSETTSGSYLLSHNGKCSLSFILSWNSHHGSAINEPNYRLATERMQIQSLASLSGLRIQHRHELWCRLQAWI